MEWETAVGFFFAVILALTIFRAKFKGDIGELAVA